MHTNRPALSGATTPLPARSSRFLSDLRTRVRSELEKPGVAQEGARRHHVKAATILIWFVASYLAMLGAGGIMGIVLSGISAGVALAGLAFNVQHDGGHGAFSERKRLNRVAAGVLDLLGTSSYLWKWKHNRLHHSAPNVDGHDDDVDGLPLLRLHPSQPLRWWHRFQHWYCWAIYPFITIRWVFVSDLVEWRRGAIGEFSYPEMSTRETFLFWVAKVQFVVWAVAIPVALHGLAGVSFFFVFQLVGGFLAAVSFQLAHCVEEAAHHPRDTDRAAVPWEELQLSSTVDFRTNRMVAWFLGGLNHQSVHHLFPGIRHTLYPRISTLLEEQAALHGLSYQCAPSLRRQVGSHYRLLRSLGAAGN